MLGIFIFLITGTTIAIIYGRGYRFSFDNGKPDLSKTGLIAATSIPEGAQVFINDELATATDDTVNLAPGEYRVKIFKEGYFPWEKTVRVEEEVVTKANALLLPTAPKLDSITSIGVGTPTLDPTKTKIGYTVASQSAEKNGIYVYDINSNPVLSFQSVSKQIADDSTNLMSEAQISWSPNGEFIIATVSGELSPATYVLKSREFNESPELVNTATNQLLIEQQLEKEEKEANTMKRLKKPLRELITNNFRIISWAPDEYKILYQAVQSVNLPYLIKPRLIGINTITEDRDIKKDAIYVYDLKEDTNYKILEGLPENCNLITGSCDVPLKWMPDANHLIHVNNGRIDILEHDGTNRTTIYAGPFIGNYVFPWNNLDKIVMLTNFNNKGVLPNLYTISLK